MIVYVHVLYAQHVHASCICMLLGCCGRSRHCRGDSFDSPTRASTRATCTQLQTRSCALTSVISKQAYRSRHCRCCFEREPHVKSGCGCDCFWRSVTDHFATIVCGARIVPYVYSPRTRVCPCILCECECVCYCFRVIFSVSRA